MRIFLTGFMASGKSAVGRQMSRDSGVDFLDLDRRIEENAGMRIPQIFETSGESEFRRLETEALGLVVPLGNLIVATGGGAVVSQENRRLMRSLGLIVWLDPHVDLLLERIRAGTPGRRPLAGSDEQLRALYESRLEAYRDCDIQVSIAAQQSVREVAERALHEIESRE